MTLRAAFDIAKSKARYGHRDWVVWQDRNGDGHAEKMTHTTIKNALRDGPIGQSLGTVDHMTMICRNDGTACKWSFKGWLGLWMNVKRFPQHLWQ